MKVKVTRFFGQRYLGARIAPSALTERLVDLVEELLLEGFVLDELTDACETLRDLVWWQSAHQVEDRVGHDTLSVLSCGLRHICDGRCVVFKDIYHEE